MFNTNLNYSKIGIGTYLGEPNQSVDDKIYNVITKAINHGINLIDTAPNYRCERSEKVIGKILEKYNREKIIISTKVGFLPFDNNLSRNYDEYFQSKFIDSGIIPKDGVYGDWQSFHPDYIDWQLNQSLKRLNTDYIDIYYLHNPDELLEFMEEDRFYSIIYDAFKFLDKMITLGKIKYIGISTWTGFLMGDNYLDLNKIIEISREALSSDNFKFIQVPYNLAMTDYLTKKTQLDIGSNDFFSLMYLAESNSIDVITSAPLYHGKLIEIKFPKTLKNILNDTTTNAELSLRFSMSNPGSNSILLGVTDLSHLDEAISLLGKDLIHIDDYSKILMGE